jgi:hypothetical protein
VEVQVGREDGEGDVSSFSTLNVTEAETSMTAFFQPDYHHRPGLYLFLLAVRGDRRPRV